MRSGRGITYISSGLLLPSKVTHLVIKRPPQFYFRPGDYVFVNIPAIAKYEWHPFTLSSAPDQEDYMWLHIRAVGEWTNRLYSYFEREQERLHNGEVAPSIPGGTACLNTTDANQISNATTTPQKDFLLKNLSRINHHSQMVKSSSFDSPRQLSGEYTTDSRANSDATTITMDADAAAIIESTMLHNENETDKKESPFNFEISTPLRPPRQLPGTSKLATENYTAPSPPISSGSNSRPRMERQISENTALKKLQASLQRTFSRKGNQSQVVAGVAAQDGYGNDGFVGDDDCKVRVCCCCCFCNTNT